MFQERTKKERLQQSAGLARNIPHEMISKREMLLACPPSSGPDCAHRRSSRKPLAARFTKGVSFSCLGNLVVGLQHRGVSRDDMTTGMDPRRAGSGQSVTVEVVDS
jgi:hypothetical protein